MEKEFGNQGRRIYKEISQWWVVTFIPVAIQVPINLASVTKKCHGNLNIWLGIMSEASLNAKLHKGAQSRLKAEIDSLKKWREDHYPKVRTYKGLVEGLDKCAS